MKQPETILKLINKFTKLPAVGTKTAQRYAYKVIEMSVAEAEDFCRAIMDVKNTIRCCGECGNYSEEEVCPLCKNGYNKIITVVAYPKDVNAIQKAAPVKTAFHVLGGTLSPIDGRGPDELNIKKLLSRLNGTEEIIIATNPDVEGEATALYLSRLIKPLNIKVTRLAQGISMGSDIEYADEVTLAKAIESRREI